MKENKTDTQETPVHPPNVPIQLPPPIPSPENKPLEKTKLITNKKRSREHER